MDLDNDGIIDYQEFMQATIDRKKLFNKKNLDDVFNLMDVNKDGKISREELTHVFQGHQKEELSNLIEEIMKECDTDGSG